MKKENDVKKNVVKISCHPGSCRTGTCGVCRLYRRLSHKANNLLFNKQLINGRCRVEAFRHDKPLCNAGFTPRSSFRFLPDGHMRNIARDIKGAPLYPAVAVRRTGVTNGACGFTLIELLVVVLIIGILAAVALPQYQKAVDKTHFMTYIQVGHGIKRAQEVYYLENGEYSPNFTNLDVDYTAGCKKVSGVPNMWTCPHGFFMDLGLGNNVAMGALGISLCPGYNTSYTNCTAHSEAVYVIYFNHYHYSSALSGTTRCAGYTARGKALCKLLP